MSKRVPIPVGLKHGVELNILRTPMWRAVYYIARVWEINGLNELIITSVNDGVHRPNSLHYDGLAVDVRTWAITDMPRVVRQLRALLGPSYDVVAEETHLHVEYDPG